MGGGDAGSSSSVLAVLVRLIALSLPLSLVVLVDVDVREMDSCSLMEADKSFLEEDRFGFLRSLPLSFLLVARCPDGGVALWSLDLV